MSNQSDPIDQEKSTAQTIRPIIVDLGKVKRKKAKQLKKGEGPLMDQINDVIKEVQSQAGDQLPDSGPQPVIVLYEKKEKKSTFGFFK